MDSITRDKLTREADGWSALAQEFREIIARIIAERDRLLGPDRGE